MRYTRLSAGDQEILLSERAAVIFLAQQGASLQTICEALHLQPVRVRKILDQQGESESKKPSIKEAKFRSTWKTKTIAAVAVLLSFGYGGKMIAQMLDIPEQSVQEIQQRHSHQIKQIQQVRNSRRRAPAKFPQSVRKTVEPTQEHLWLARALFAEAANQPKRCKEAIAQVIMNRVNHSRYPDSVLEVIKQPWQFSSYPNSRLWRMTERPEDMNRINRRAWDQCVSIARQALNGNLSDRVGRATLFHDDSISMPWDSSKVSAPTIIGNMRFYTER